ncbi:uncharacterized protein MONBRDRAFT_12828 [Monosiga brevicollis MX1]|uniref:Uncharacterized protein n=1 Tax=Monosiga brevicollis TaxID=81824 RepID=A9VDF9_MONBE|nr:uncharacterized protein MONBRDRAFT_12828 [Monosiga brevicollis MX1]EDQ84467.1 predicted protein [Monosiga brevicollis MX1]|eukprot:XP_001750762.1 hypothetical protein [Monosiga brevicollis MX1]
MAQRFADQAAGLVDDTFDQADFAEAPAFPRHSVPHNGYPGNGSAGQDYENDDDDFDFEDQPTQPLRRHSLDHSQDHEQNIRAVAFEQYRELHDKYEQLEQENENLNAECMRLRTEVAESSEENLALADRIKELQVEQERLIDQLEDATKHYSGPHPADNLYKQVLRLQQELEKMQEEHEREIDALNDALGENSETGSRYSLSSVAGMTEMIEDMRLELESTKRENAELRTLNEQLANETVDPAAINELREQLELVTREHQRELHHAQQDNDALLARIAELEQAPVEQPVNVPLREAQQQTSRPSTAGESMWPLLTPCALLSRPLPPVAHLHRQAHVMPPTSPPFLNRSVEGQSAQVIQLQEQVARLEAQLSEAKRRASLVNREAALQAENVDLRDELLALEADIAATHATTNASAADMAELERQLERARDENIALGQEVNELHALLEEAEERFQAELEQAQQMNHRPTSSGEGDAHRPGSRRGSGTASSSGAPSVPNSQRPPFRPAGAPLSRRGSFMASGDVGPPLERRGSALSVITPSGAGPAAAEGHTASAAPSAAPSAVVAERMQALEEENAWLHECQARSRAQHPHRPNTDKKARRTGAPVLATARRAQDRKTEQNMQKVIDYLQAHDCSPNASTWKQVNTLFALCTEFEQRVDQQGRELDRMRPDLEQSRSLLRLHRQDQIAPAIRRLQTQLENAEQGTQDRLFEVDQLRAQHQRQQDDAYSRHQGDLHRDHAALSAQRKKLQRSESEAQDTIRSLRDENRQLSARGEARERSFAAPGNVASGHLASSHLVARQMEDIIQRSAADVGALREQLRNERSRHQQEVQNLEQQLRAARSLNKETELTDTQRLQAEREQQQLEMERLAAERDALQEDLVLAENNIVRLQEAAEDNHARVLEMEAEFEAEMQTLKEALLVEQRRHESDLAGAQRFATDNDASHQDRIERILEQLRQYEIELNNNQQQVDRLQAELRQAHAHHEENLARLQQEHSLVIAEIHENHEAELERTLRELREIYDKSAVEQQATEEYKEREREALERLRRFELDLETERQRFAQERAALTERHQKEQLRLEGELAKLREARNMDRIQAEADHAQYLQDIEAAEHNAMALRLALAAKDQELEAIRDSFEQERSTFTSGVQRFEDQVNELEEELNRLRLQRTEEFRDMGNERARLQEQNRALAEEARTKAILLENRTQELDYLRHRADQDDANRTLLADVTRERDQRRVNDAAQQEQINRLTEERDQLARQLRSTENRLATTAAERAGMLDALNRDRTTQQEQYEKEVVELQQQLRAARSEDGAHREALAEHERLIDRAWRGLPKDEMSAFATLTQPAQKLRQLALATTKMTAQLQRAEQQATTAQAKRDAAMAEVSELRDRLHAPPVLDESAIVAQQQEQQAQQRERVALERQLMESREENAALAARLQSVQNELQQHLTHARDEAGEAQAMLETVRHGFEAERATFDEQMGALRAELADAREATQAARNKVREAERRTEEARGLVRQREEELASTTAALATARREATAAGSRVAELEERAAQLQSELSATVASLEPVSRELQQCTAALEAARQDLATAQDDGAAFEAQTRALSEQMATAEEQLKALALAQETARHAQADVQSLKDEAVRLRLANEELQREVAQLRQASRREAANHAALARELERQLDAQRAVANREKVNSASLTGNNKQLREQLMHLKADHDRLQQQQRVDQAAQQEMVATLHDRERRLMSAEQRAQAVEAENARLSTHRRTLEDRLRREQTRMLDDMHSQLQLRNTTMRAFQRGEQTTMQERSMHNVSRRLADLGAKVQMERSVSASPPRSEHAGSAGPASDQLTSTMRPGLTNAALPLDLGAESSWVAATALSDRNRASSVQRGQQRTITHNLQAASSFEPRTTPVCNALVGEQLNVVDAIINETLATLHRRHDHLLWKRGVASILNIARSRQRHNLSAQLVLLQAQPDVETPLALVDRDAVITTAAAVELLHLFMLIQDDVMDASVRRRNCPTVNVALEHVRTKVLRGPSMYSSKELSKSYAVVLSDCLHASANRLFMEVARELPTTSAAALSQVIEDVALTAASYQFEDMLGWRMHAWESDAAVVEAVESILHLTAQLRFVLPLSVGAALTSQGTPHPQVIAAAQQFGAVFKILADVNEFVAEPGSSGRSPMRNLEEGRLSCVVSKLFTECSRQERHDLMTIVPGESWMGAQPSLICRLVIQYNVLSDLLDECRSRLIQANEELASVPEPALAQGLTAISVGLQQHAGEVSRAAASYVNDFHSDHAF